MKVILVFVASLDGKITRWGDPMVRKWSSEEDQRYFTGIMNNARLIVMGSNTFNADPIIPRENRLMIVMTKNPEKYKKYELQGQINFSNKSPSELTDYFKGEGYKEMVVVGGPLIASSFLRGQLIDEIWLTVEPRIFGNGANFVINEKLDIRLRLLSSETINVQGSLINKYAVIR